MCLPAIFARSRLTLHRLVKSSVNKFWGFNRTWRTFYVGKTVNLIFWYLMTPKQYLFDRPFKVHFVNSSNIIVSDIYFLEEIHEIPPLLYLITWPALPTIIWNIEMHNYMSSFETTSLLFFYNIVALQHHDIFQHASIFIHQTDESSLTRCDIYFSS